MPFFQLIVFNYFNEVLFRKISTFTIEPTRKTRIPDRKYLIPLNFDTAKYFAWKGHGGCMQVPN